VRQQSRLPRWTLSRRCFSTSTFKRVDSEVICGVTVRRRTRHVGDGGRTTQLSRVTTGILRPVEPQLDIFGDDTRTRQNLSQARDSAIVKMASRRYPLESLMLKPLAEQRHQGSRTAEWAAAVRSGVADHKVFLHRSNSRGEGPTFPTPPTRSCVPIQSRSAYRIAGEVAGCGDDAASISTRSLRSSLVKNHRPAGWCSGGLR